MKLGQTCYCPKTGEQGTYLGIQWGVPVGITLGGRKFQNAKAHIRDAKPKKPGPKPNVGAVCQVRMLDGTSGWLDAVFVGTKRVRITSPDKIWFGAEMATDQVEVRR